MEFMEFNIHLQGWHLTGEQQLFGLYGDPCHAYTGTQHSDIPCYIWDG